MTVGSLFDGIGGFPLAAAMNGFQTLWTSDIEPQCETVTRAHFPDAVQLGDITKIDGGSIPPVDIITGGSPCQDLSVAGKRAGLEGERSGLFMDQMRVVRQMRKATGGKQPRYMIWENVPGAFSSNGGDDYHAIIDEIVYTADTDRGGGASIPRPEKWSNAGAVMGDEFSIAWRVLDAQFWGVPQRRRRVFLVADFGGATAPEILFVEKSVRGHSASGGETGQRAASNVARCAGGSGAIGLNAFDAGENRTSQMVIENNQADGRFKICEDNIVPTLTARMDTGGNNGPMVAYRMLGFGDYVEDNKSGNLQARDSRGPESLVTGKRGRKYTIRRLTPLECERLQGFPDGWTDIEHNGRPMSDSARYRMLGNSVAIPCVDFIFRQIAMSAKKEHTHA